MRNRHYQKKGPNPRDVTTMASATRGERGVGERGRGGTGKWVMNCPVRRGRGLSKFSGWGKTSIPGRGNRECKLCIK